MRLPTLFKQNRNKTYSYTPRYYNERKERLESIKKKHGISESNSDSKPQRRVSFKDDWKQNSKLSNERDTRLRLLVILAFLLLAAFGALNYLDIRLF